MTGIGSECGLSYEVQIVGTFVANNVAAQLLIIKDHGMGSLIVHEVPHMGPNLEASSSY